MRKTLAVAAVAAALALGAPPVAGAFEAGEKIWLHGYGNWAYGKTDGNAYMNGNDEGNYDELEFSLSVAAEPVERTSIHAQIFIEKSEEGSEASVDFAFAEYAFDPALQVPDRRRQAALRDLDGDLRRRHALSLRQPRAGDLRPRGFVAESYLGVGFTGRLDVGSGWQMQYDLYGGEMESALSTPWAEAGGDEAGEASTDVQDLIGGRLNLTSPGQSLTGGISAYTGTEDTETFGEESESHRHTAYGAHLEYFLGPAALRAEYAGQDTEEYTSNAAYAEASWKLATHWLVAARYDWAKTKLEEDAGVDEDLLEHQDVGLAVNYFFSPNFVLKLAVHQVTGNRFTSVDDEDAEQDEKTTLVTFGTSFSF